MRHFGYEKDYFYLGRPSGRPSVDGGSYGFEGGFGGGGSCCSGKVLWW